MAAGERRRLISTPSLIKQYSRNPVNFSSPLPEMPDVSYFSRQEWAISAVVAQQLYTLWVGGSNPSSPTIFHQRAIFRQRTPTVSLAQPRFLALAVKGTPRSRLPSDIQLL